MSLWIFANHKVVIAYIGYTHNELKLSYWRTYTGLEVDAVIGDAQIAIEIRSCDLVQNKHLKGIRAFAEEHTDCRKLVVSLDRITRTTDDNIELIYVREFLSNLWKGLYF